VKITITPTGLTAFVLADDTIAQISGTSWPNGAGGTYKEGLNPEQERRIQVQPLFRAAYAAVFVRFNFVNTLSFTVERWFGSYDMNFNFVSLHADVCPVGGEIMMANTGVGSLVRYNPGSVLRKPRCEEYTGVYCRWKYDITLGGPWQNSP